MKQFYLIGQNIKNSLSPKIHKTIYSELNEKADYQLFPCDSLVFPSGFEGLNVTIPYKELVISKLSQDKSGCGSVNTIKKIRDSSGEKLIGYSTDGAGFLLDAKRLGLNLENVLIIGTGGAAKSIAFSLKDKGKISVKSRSKKNQQDFCKKFNARSYDKEQNYSLVINCTPCYLVDNFGKGKYYDIKYGKGSHGLGMLIYQAILSAEIFLEKSIDKKIFYIIYKALS